jgi:Cupin domain
VGTSPLSFTHRAVPITREPHDQDEAYIVASGSGMFRRGEERIPFQPGDFLFAAAGVPHRFEEFTDDFQTWVIFFGPKGGVGRYGAIRMAGLGHEERFPPTRLSAGCGFRKETIAGMRRNGRDA